MNARYSHRFTFIAMLVLLTATMTAAITHAQAEVVSATDFRNTMRVLWVDHIVWTRLYLVSAIEALPDQEIVAERLLRNQDDIGDAVKPFYGDEAGTALAALLREHILGAVDLLEAAMSGNDDDVQTASDAWYANADEIAAFLHAANPEQWTEAALAHEMYMHLDLTLEEAQARLAGDYAAEIAAFDAVQEHILHMADILSEGTIQQFPDRFAA